MELLALNAAHHHLTEEWSLGLVNRDAKTVSFRCNSRFLSGLCGGSEELALPGDGVEREQREDGCSDVRLPDANPASCSVTAPGNTPTAPCGASSFCFPGTPRNKFENSGIERRTNFFRTAPKKALLGLGSVGPFAY
ncbi:hypothetical protein [Granulicella sp. dw_53]|uniref:hypothetical protein n=1 Tax=Granulicella sp. dw_53 TaxID=2719792 RepID=UPI001BD34AB2|nr:hypothetical protein [Granulicella sp. dw_53]